MILPTRMQIFFRWSCDIDIHMFLYGLLGTTYRFFYYLCVVYNNFIVKYQLCLNKLFSVSVSVSVYGVFKLPEKMLKR